MRTDFAQLRRLPELFRQTLPRAPAAQTLNRRELLLRGVERFVHIRHIAVHGAVGAVADGLVHLRGHDVHGRGRGADRREQILDVLGLLEIDHRRAAAADAARQKAHLRQQRRHLAAGLRVRAGQLEVIALLGIRHAPAREKRPAQKRRPAALVLKQSEIDVQHHRLARVIAELVDDPVELLRIGNLENELSVAAVVLGQAVELHRKRPLKQARQARGKLGVFRDNAHQRRRERVAVQQHAIGLRPRAAQTADRRAAELTFDFIGKRLHRPPTFPLCCAYGRGWTAPRAACSAPRAAPSARARGALDCGAPDHFPPTPPGG